MSRRNKLLEKKARAMERAIRKGRVPTHFNLVHWLEDRGLADTGGQARELIQKGRVKADSHVLDGKHVVEVEVPAKNNINNEKKSVEIFSAVYPSVLLPSIQFSEE